MKNPTIHMSHVVLDDIIYIFPETVVEMTKGRYYMIMYSYDDRCLYGVTITKKRSEPKGSALFMTLKYDGTWYHFQIRPLAAKGYRTAEEEVNDAFARKKARSKREIKGPWKAPADWLKFISAKAHEWQFTHGGDEKGIVNLVKCNVPLPARKYSCEVQHSNESSCRRDYVGADGQPCDDTTDDSCLPRCYWDVQKHSCQNLGDDRDALAVKNLRNGAVQDANGRVDWSTSYDSMADLYAELGIEPPERKEDALSVVSVPPVPRRRLPEERPVAVSTVPVQARNTNTTSGSDNKYSMDELLAML